MNLLDAKNLALKLMKQHGLEYWRFEFNSRKRAFGVCNYRKRTIFLSSVLTEAVNVEHVTDTILHEIAHALVGASHGHNYVWQRKAIEIGCNGQRCSNEKVDIDAKYVAKCVCCDKTFKKHRKPKHTLWCKCTNRRFREEEKLNFVQQY